MPTVPNQPSEASAHCMFELAKTVLTKAGGNSSTSLFTQVCEIVDKSTSVTTVQIQDAPAYNTHPAFWDTKMGHALVENRKKVTLLSRCTCTPIFEDIFGQKKCLFAGNYGRSEIQKVSYFCDVFLAGDDEQQPHRAAPQPALLRLPDRPVRARAAQLRVPELAVQDLLVARVLDHRFVRTFYVCTNDSLVCMCVYLVLQPREFCADKYSCFGDGTE